MHTAPVRVENGAEGVALGWVCGEGVRVGPCGRTWEAEFERALERWRGREEDPKTTCLKAAVRQMLRHGSYKPTGRGKPASEYLLHAALEGRFPRVSNVVDAANLASLESLLPISLLDVDRVGSESFGVRWGRAGERYIFNRSGQDLDLQDLLLTASLPGDIPCGSPVKDSQATKVVSDSRRILGIVYAPFEMADLARGVAERLARFFETEGIRTLSGSSPE
ncbi:MAG: phenylalanine--tRNA ligase beta subunit-related protein [Acidobacteriota bacterium]